MRYDNWDVILFPKDSAVPIQEFRTACYVSQDEHGRQLSTLTCYIASLPPAAPFRVSIHSWAAPAKPSALIESRRRSAQKVAYATQVIVDGARLFHGFYDTGTRWPQEILKEKRSATEPQPANQQRPFLAFPPFNENVLMQRSWDAREHNGRIKVLLSEQLMNKDNSPGDLGLGFANDIVCFAFQHAPQDILEQAGISWPIRNPLYLASGLRCPQIPQAHVPHAKVRDLTAENRARSSLSQHSPSMFARPRNPDPYSRPRTNPPPQVAHFPKPATGGKIRPGFWDPLTVDSFSESNYDMSMDGWSTKRTSSHSTGDASISDMLYASPVFGQSGDPWTMIGAPYEVEGKDGDSKQTRREKGTRQVVVTLRDDQLGQLIEAISPPKKGREREANCQRPSIGTFSAHPTQATKVPGSTSARPSAAALARKASYHEFHKMSSNMSPDKEDRSSSRMQDARLPTGFPHANRIPTPHPFVAPQAHMNQWDSDVSMHEASSMFSNLSHFGQSHRQNKGGESSTAPMPAASGGVKSRKEGRNLLATPPTNNAGQDQSLLPERGPNMQHNGPNITSPHANIEDIIDIDAVDKAFAPGHKGGKSSVDSTGRIERKLYSALGEELNFHADADDDAGPMTGIESGSVIDVSNLDDLDTPVVKRKRQATPVGERDHSPAAKMAREDRHDADIRHSSDVPHLRGGI